MTHLGHMMTCLDNNPSTEHAFFFYSGKETHPVISMTSGRHRRPDSSRVLSHRHWYSRRLQCASAFQILLFIYFLSLHMCGGVSGCECGCTGAMAHMEKAETSTPSVSILDFQLA